MGRLVVEEEWPEGAEVGDVPLDGIATRLLDETGTWEEGGREEVFLLRLVPKPNDLRRELIRSM